jgi:hypothetical protein
MDLYKKRWYKYPVQLAVTALRNENNTIYGLLGIYRYFKNKKQAKLLSPKKMILKFLMLQR